MPSTIELKNFNLGGLADSRYQGVQNSLATIVGFDLHSEPGVLKVHQKLTKESGSTIDALVKTIRSCSDGKSYLFSSTSGKIWSRTSGGTYTLEATAAPAAGAASILDAAEHNGYLYYSMQSRLGRWQIGTAWSTRNDSWATFMNTDALFHPIFLLNGVLYIGDKNYIAQVDESNVFTGNALDIPSTYRIKSLWIDTNDLLIGTYINDNVNMCRIIRWNTWSESWTNEDDVPEVGINGFIPMDNTILLSAGTKGFFYLYEGARLEQFMRLPGAWDSTKKATVHKNAAALFQKRTLFGLSNIAGNPALQGVYSYGSYSRNYPRVLSLDYIISQNLTSSIEIGAIEAVGDDFLVAWKDGSNYGVDKIDWSNKYASAYFETRVIDMARSIQKTIDIKINYRSIPANCDITLQKSVNYAAYANVDLVNDSKRLCKYAKVKILEANTVQFKIAAAVNANNAPEIESVEISIT